MIRTFKALSALLSYPTADLVAASGEISGAIEADGLVPERVLDQLHVLIAELATGDLYDHQERYVLLFDRTRSLSLHLFEHVHGESRDRGQAMIDLKTQYEAAGLEISASELPDFLPLFLEYLSIRPLSEAGEALGQTAHILTALAERLRKRKSAYEAIFRALAAIAAAKPKDDDIAAILAEADPDPSDLAALDAAWEDEPVTFGPAANPCKDGLIARLRAAKRPAAGNPEA
jgi:nitrate reductase molybdenum cofactor assembly chaperone NarJ/NarW